MAPCVLLYLENKSCIIGFPSVTSPTNDGIAINIFVFIVCAILSLTDALSPCVYDATMLGSIEADIADATPCGIPINRL